MVSIVRYTLLLFFLISQGLHVFAQEPENTGYIGLGAGTMTFFGDVRDQNSGFAPTLGRPSYHIRLHAPLNHYLEGGVEGLFGTMAAHERGTDRNLNFSTEIRSAGLFLSYDFEGILPDERSVSPVISLGFSGFEFLSKSDLLDGEGRPYFYWDDGTIRDMAQDAEMAPEANIVSPDYEYETDLRELDLDGLGDYNERGFAIPIGLGFRFDLGKYLDFDIHTRYYLTTTDYIDNVSSEGIGVREGDSRNDSWMYTGFALSYGFHKKKEVIGSDVLDEEFLAGVNDRADQDDDGVLDLIDECPNTPEDVAVDVRGCPLDEDKDGVPDYLDLELMTPEGSYVDADGVALDDDHFEKQLKQYLSDTDVNFIEGTVESASIPKPVFTPRPGKKYMIQVGETAEGIPGDLAKALLSIPDIQTISKGDTLLYMVGDYENLPDAIRRQLSLSDAGIDGAVVSSEDGDVTNVSKEARKLRREMERDGQLSESVAEELDAAVIWRVQVGAFRNPLTYDVYSGIPDIITIQGRDALTRYFSGVYDNREDAERYRGILQNSGYNDAFLAAFRSGERINVREALSRNSQMSTDDLWDRVSPDPFDMELVRYRLVLEKSTGAIDAEKLERLREIGRIDQVSQSGLTYYVIGFYQDREAAEEKLQEYVTAGLQNVAVIGSFNGSLIEMDIIETMMEGAEE